MQITIIGAGPLGCYAGCLLAKSGHQVSIYENHSEIGQPIQCTGLLTTDFDQFNIPKDSFLINTFQKIEVFSPNRRIELKQKEYLVCRKKFDNYFADLAKAAGAQIFLNHSFLRKEGEKLAVKDNNNHSEKRIKPEIIIAADGALSSVAKAYGFYHPLRQNYFGLQAVVEGRFNRDAYQTYFGTETCPDLFAWIVPESDTKARVGLATTKNSRKYFDDFIRQHHFDIVEMQAGTIPLFHPQQQLKKDNCYLLGDAAGFVKATTLGGLIPGMKQAEILVDCLCNDKDYEEQVAFLKKRLKLHLRIRKFLNRFSDDDWDRLLTYIDQPRISKVLEKQKHTRENPAPLVSEILLKEPRFLYFLKYLR